MSQTAPSHVPMRRVATASCIGTTIEFYDFLIYGTAAALVFSEVFFPALGAVAGTAASFATFAVAFVARPFGAVLFGHYGDKLGRKGTLVTTLLMMGIATVAIGLLPTADTIGAAAPVLLVLLRILQGLAVGGEWAGATLLSAEYAPEGKRGFYAVFPQLGPSIAFGLASATFLISDALVSGDAFLAWGWRVPFIASTLLVAVGLYVRLKIEETPAFKRDVIDVSDKVKAPFFEVLKVQPREILLSAGLMGILFGFFYMGVSFLTAVGTDPEGLALERRTVLVVGVLAAVVMAAATVVGGRLSDALGRKRVIIGSSIASLVWSLALFPIIEIGGAFAFGVGVIVTLAIFGIAYGPVGAFLPELFETRFRYTGAGTGYNLGGVLGGAIPPILAAPLTEAYGTIAIGVMLAVLAVVGIASTLALRETARDRSLQRAVSPAA